MSENNLIDPDRKSEEVKIDNKDIYDSNNDRNDGPAPGRSRWITFFVISFAATFLSIASNSFDFPVKMPFGVIPLLFFFTLFCGFKVHRINKEYGINDGYFTPKYETPEELENLQQNQRAFRTFGDCVGDLIKRHVFIALPVIIFYGAALFVMLLFLNFDNGSEEMPKSFKGLVKYLFRNNPVYATFLSLTVLAFPFILCFVETGMVGMVVGEDADLGTCLFLAFAALVPTAFLTNFLSGFVSMASLFLSLIFGGIFGKK